MPNHTSGAALGRASGTKSALARLSFLVAALALGSPAHAEAPPAAAPAAAQAPAGDAPQDTPARARRRARRKERTRDVVEALEKTITFYGILKPTVAVASTAVESFGRPNESAITAAGNPVLAASPDDVRFTFQVAQSRVGAKIREGRAIRGQVELDFIDFEKSSPTVASLPRLRQAFAEWDPAPNHTILLGQTWDMVAPLMPHHFNLVGANFQAGNLGFMRPQIQWTWHPSTVELGLALGLPVPNAGPSVGPVELGPMPTFAARVGWKPSAAFSLTASGLVTELAPTPDDRTLSWVVALGAEVKTEFGLNLRAEGYVSQNTSNLGMLTLSQGRPGVDIRDAGGWLSVRQTIGKHAAPYLTVGGAAVLNPGDVALAYTPATDTAAAVRLTTAGPGIHWNVAARLGLEVPIAGGFSLQAEGFAHVTEHALAAQDADVGAVRQAYGMEGGAIYRF